MYLDIYLVCLGNWQKEGTAGNVKFRESSRASESILGADLGVNF